MLERSLANEEIDFSYLWISQRATVPGQKQWGFFTPPVAGAAIWAALVESCWWGACPPVDFWAVCLTHAMLMIGDNCVWNSVYVVSRVVWE